MKKYYLTTPIYYVNGAPHLGHAYTTIAADVMARHHRQRGDDVFFLTGTDEHGEPVALAAEREGVSPQELANRNAERFKALAPQLNASNDFFIRTSDEAHKAKVQEVLTRVKDAGYVYEGTYEGWYCPRCADFKNESEIAEGNTCPIHKIALTRAIGFALGIFPSLGSGFLLCGLAAWGLKLNQPIIQATGTLAYPLQLLLLLPFYRAGESLFGVPSIPLSIPVLLSRFFENIPRFLSEYGMTGVRGIIVWSLLAPVVLAVLHFSLRPLLRRAAARLGQD